MRRKENQEELTMMTHQAPLQVMKKKQNLCLMTRQESDTSSVSSCTSLNAENYSQLLQAFK